MKTSSLAAFFDTTNESEQNSDIFFGFFTSLSFFKTTFTTHQSQAFLKSLSKDKKGINSFMMREYRFLDFNKSTNALISDVRLCSY